MNIIVRNAIQDIRSLWVTTIVILLVDLIHLNTLIQYVIIVLKHVKHVLDPITINVLSVS